MNTSTINVVLDPVDQKRGHPVAAVGEDGICRGHLHGRHVARAKRHRCRACSSCRDGSTQRRRGFDRQRLRTRRGAHSQKDVRKDVERDFLAEAARSQCVAGDKRIVRGVISVAQHHVFVDAPANLGSGLNRFLIMRPLHLQPDGLGQGAVAVVA